MPYGVEKMKKNTYWKFAALLAGVTCLPAHAVTSAADTRPAPEDFPSYTLYLQALFNYQRGHAYQKAAPALAESKPAESLDDAIANAGNNPGYVDTSAHPRSTFKSFNLAQIPTQDMSQNNIENALGLYNDHSLQQPPGTTARLRADNDISLTPDVEMRLISDAYYAAWQTDSDLAQNTFSGRIGLPEGEAYASASVKKSTQGDHGLDLTLSSKVRTNLYIVDQDGIPGSHYAGAGALAIQPLSLEFQDISSHITVIEDQYNNDFISIQAGTPNAIILDLSGSRFGAADAKNGTGSLVLSQSQIGRINYFAEFGPNSLLTIAPGMKMDIKIGHPDGMTKPLATVTGSINNITLGGIRLLAQDTGNQDTNSALQIGSIGISDLDINLRLFIDNSTVVIDMGPSKRDMSLSLERIALGPNTTTSVVGDLYVSRVGISNARISIAAH